MNSKFNIKIEELKKSVPIWLIAQGRIAKLTRRGEEYDGLCPYHDEDNPSFQMYRNDDGTYLGHCQSCGVTKNVFQLVQDMDGVDFQKAVKIVEDVLRNPEWEKKRAAADAVFRQTLNQKSKILAVPVAAFDSYRKALQESKEAQDWLRNRGISKDTAEEFCLGFVQKPLSTIVPTNHPWHSKGWILFPEIRDGHIISVKYRSIVGKRIKTDSGQQWSGFATRPDMVKRVLYNLEAVSPLEDVLIVEGEPDCLVLAQAGFCSVSLPSAGFSPTPDMRIALMNSNARYLAGDMDEVGTAAMLKLFKEFNGENPKSKTYIIQWPKPCKDANETFLKVCSGDVEQFKNLVVRLMDEARARKVPGIQDLKQITRNTDFKPTRSNPNRLLIPWPNINSWVDILPGEVMFMFGTETKAGKSTWLMNILIHNVLNGKKVINFSAELSPERYAQMVSAHLLGRNRGELTTEDFQVASEKIPEESFYYGYKPGAKFQEVMKLLADAKQVYGGDIFVVDPLHFLIRGSDNETKDFAAAMRELVDFSIKWNVIMVVVGQARKAAQGNRGKMAQGQDARFSAALGEDAASTWIIHRDRIGKKSMDGEEEPVFGPVAKIKLEYARNGEPNSTRLVFDGATATFKMYAGYSSPADTTTAEIAEVEEMAI